MSDLLFACMHECDKSNMKIAHHNEFIHKKKVNY